MPDEACRLYRRATATGDEGAWSDLVATCDDEIRRRLRALVGRQRLSIPLQEIDEMVQDLWCRLVALPPSAQFRGTTDAELWGWFQRILRRLVLDTMRRRSTKKRRAEVVGDDWIGEEGIGWRETVVSPDRDPEACLLLKERARQVERACREVTGPGQGSLCLRVLRLALVEGLSSFDVAHQVRELEPRQVDGLMHRLRRRLAARGLLLPHRAAFAAS